MTDEEIIDLIVVLRCQLYGGRESCSAQSDDTGFLYDIHDLVTRELCIVSRLTETLDRFILLVVLYYNCVYHGSASRQLLLDTLYST